MAMRFRSLVVVVLAGGLWATAQAATPEEEGAAAAGAWAKAVMAADIEAQLKLLPKRLFLKPGEREREEKRLMHDKEVALINGDRYLSFEVQPKAVATGKVGNTVVMMFPYRSVFQTKGAKLQRDSSLIAIAEEGSSSWSVIDGSAQSTKSMRFLVPGYAGRPPIPRPVTKAIPTE